MGTQGQIYSFSELSHAPLTKPERLQSLADEQATTAGEVTPASRAAAQEAEEEGPLSTEV